MEKMLMYWIIIYIKCIKRWYEIERNRKNEKVSILYAEAMGISIQYFNDIVNIKINIDE